MSKPIFLEVQAYYHTKETSLKEDACMECLKEANEKAEVLGLPAESLEEECDSICGETIDEDTTGLETESMIIKLQDIKSISKSQKGNAIIQTHGSFLPRMYATQYKDLMEKIKDLIIII
jgi:hypothetical protein